MSDRRVLVLRGKLISEDGAGNICLDDLWELSRKPETNSPKRWRVTKGAQALISELQKKVINSDLKGESPYHPVIYAKQGRGNVGTFAHPVLAAAYAGYLSPKLEIEIREIWLRYRAGDASLADEILQRASKEANEWAGRRALSRAQRIAYTDTLKAHGVTGRGYPDCTDAVYLHLLGGRASKLRADKGLPAKSNLRNGLSIAELSFVMAAEALSAERIEEEDRQGNQECVEASATSASAIRKAILNDRRDRQPRLRHGNDTL